MEPETLLNDEKALWDDFLALTREQAQLLASEDIDGFNASLAKRRTLIEKLDALKPALESLAEKSKDASELRRPIGGTISEIQKLDAQNRKTLEGLMSQLSVEIKQTAQSQKGLGGYGQMPPPYDSEYFDRKQ